MKSNTDIKGEKMGRVFEKIPLFFMIFLSLPLFGTPFEDFNAFLLERDYRGAHSFLSHEFDIDIRGENGETSLINMIKGENRDQVRWLINQGADVNLGDFQDKTPLMYGAEKGDLPLIKLLLYNGASINAYDKGGETALSYSINQLHFKNSIYFLKKNGTLLQKKFSHPMLSQIFEPLLDYYLSLSLIEQHLKGFSLLSSAVEGDYSRASALISLKENINVQDSLGMTPLMLSLAQNDSYLSHLLIKEGADLFLKDNRGRDALWYSAYNGQKDIVNIILKEEGLIEYPFIEDSPLFAALLGQNYEIFTALINAGFDPYIQGELGYNLSAYAAFLGDMKIFNIFKEYNIDILGADGQRRNCFDYLLQAFKLNSTRINYESFALYFKEEGLYPLGGISDLNSPRITQIIKAID